MMIAACGCPQAAVSASNLSLRFILSLRLYSSFITSGSDFIRQDILGWVWKITSHSHSAYMQRERAGNIFLVPGGDGLPEADHWLCAHNTLLKMVPINDRVGSHLQKAGQ